jgi:chaperone modulatory protein CbpM
MIEAQEFLALIRADAGALERWIDAGWLAPVQDESGRGFTEVDVARAHLIRELRDDLGVNDDGVSVILDLLDQMHGLRWALRELLQATNAQPDPLRQRIAAEIRDRAMARLGDAVPAQLKT